MTDDEIEALLEECVDGPWSLDKSGSTTILRDASGMGIADLLTSTDDTCAADDLIAAARTLVPALIARAKKGEGAIGITEENLRIMREMASESSDPDAYGPFVADDNASPEAIMTDAQKLSFRKFILEHRPTEFHHGDCVGADAEAHDIVREVLPGCRIVVHPPIDSTRRAFKKGDRTMPEGGFLARNREIVARSDRVIGASGTPQRCATGGTWYTLDYAVKTLGVATVIWPNVDVHSISSARPL